MTLEHPGWTSRPRTISAVSVLLVLLVGAVAARMLPGVGVATGFDPVFDGWLKGCAYVLAAGLAVLRPLVSPVRRRGWIWIAAALTARAAGFVIHLSVIRWMDPVPYPSVADLFWILSAVLLLGGLVELARDAFPRRSVAITLDAVVAVLAAAALAIVLLEGTLQSLGAPGPAVPVLATNLAYPVLDIGMLVAVVALIASYRWHPPVGMAVLGAGVAGMATTDVVFLYQVAAGSFRPGGALSVLSLVATAATAAAAWVPRRHTHGTGRSNLPDIVAPMVFVLACVALLVLGTQRPIPNLAVALAAGGLVVAVVRAGLSFRLVAEITRLRHAQELARIGDVEVDGDGRVSGSPVVYDILGVAPDRAVSREAFEGLLHPDDRGRVKALEGRAREMGRLDVTCRVVRPDGEGRVVHLVGAARYSSEGTWLGWRGTLQDITEQDRRQQERLRLLQRTVSSADDERQRLAEHLHDDAVQLLSAAVLRLDLLEVDSGATERVHGPLAEAIASLRTTIAELAPPAVDAQTFETAVRSYAERVLVSDGIDVDIDIHLDPGLDAPSTIMSTAYRVTQEALANVRRHAEARHVQVTVIQEERTLRGTVVDDGVGIGPAAVEESSARAGHLGLRLMVERVETAHGTISVGIPDRGSGTRVVWTLPV